MSTSTRASSPLKSVIGASLVIVLTSGVASLGVGLFGGVSFANSASAATHAITGEATPARTLIADTLASLGKLGNTGPISWASDKPFPFNCGTPDAAPAASASSPVTVNGVNATVAVSAYSAGLGASTYPQLITSVSTCTGPLDVVTASPASLGTESSKVTVNRGGTVKATAITRAGDIVWFVSSPDPDVTDLVSKDVAGTVNTLASKLCADQSSVAADATRNLVLGAKYTVYSRQATATITDPGLPVVDTATLAPVPLDTPIISPEPAAPEKVPAWPVWPTMPDPLPVPTITEPAFAPPLSAPYTEQLLDKTGPGCGWSFTDASAPTENRKTIKAKDDASRGKVEDTLNAGAAVWTEQVLQFWKAWPDYQQSIVDYTTYQTAVKTTNAAWDVINSQWAVYNASLATYNADLAAYNAKVAKIAKAKSDYAVAVAACKAEPTASPSPTATPEPTPSPSATPAADSTDCDNSVPKPAELTEADPVAPVAPTAPADPRPLDVQVAAKAAAGTSAGAGPGNG